MSCLGDDDVVRDATIEQMSQAVFSASPLGALGDYINRPTKLNQAGHEPQRGLDTKTDRLTDRQL
jgi:hypothetical protein